MAFTKNQQRMAAAVFGVTFLIILLVLAIVVPKPTPFQYTVFRIILALAAAGVAAMIPGFLTVDIGTAVRAGGALGIFVVVYFFSPAQLVTEPPEASEQSQLLLATIQNEQVHPTVTVGFEFDSPILRGRFVSEEVEAKERAEPSAVRRSTGFIERSVRDLFFPFRNNAPIYSGLDAIVPIGEFIVQSNHWREPVLVKPTGLIEGSGFGGSQSLESFDIIVTDQRIGLTVRLSRPVNPLAIFDDVRQTYVKKRPAFELVYNGLPKVKVAARDVVGYWKKHIKRARVTYYLDEQRRFFMAADIEPHGHLLEDNGYSVTLQYHFSDEPRLARRFVADRSASTGRIPRFLRTDTAVRQAELSAACVALPPQLPV